MKVPAVALIAFFGVIGLAKWESAYAEQVVMEEESFKELAKEATIETVTVSVIEETDSMEEEKEKAYVSPIDFVGLRDQNSDVSAWIKINGTDIDYPVMFTGDEYYLNRNFNGEKSANGTIFFDPYQDPENLGKEANTILLGHHMKNGSMFAAIDNFTDPEFFGTHQEIYLYFEDSEYSLSPMVCVVGKNDGTLRTVDNAEKLRDFCSDKTIANGEISEFEQIFVLVTCNYWDTDFRTYLFCTINDERP